MRRALVVVASLAAVALVGYFAAAAWTGVRVAHDEARRRVACMSNLSQLAQFYLMQARDDRAKAQAHEGVSLWLSYRKGQSEILRGDERVLLCPDDPAARLPEAPSDHDAWDKVDLSNPQPGLCSYAGRDFARCPLVAGDEHQPIGACLHHPGGVVVTFADGSAEFLTLKDLALDSEADKIVGPDSKSPLLRVLR